MSLLEIKGLKVVAGGREILHGVDLEVGEGETVVLKGKNGAGKSTVGMAVMGLIGKVAGEIWFEGEEISEMAIDERARRGIFMSWQAPVEIEGVSMEEVLRMRSMTDVCKRVGVEPWVVKRDLNVGFSGGEKKKNELIQMMMLGPKMAILDELDSGLDREAARRVSRVLREYQEETGVAYLVITHNQWILEELEVGRWYELDSGWMEEGSGKNG